MLVGTEEECISQILGDIDLPIPGKSIKKGNEREELARPVTKFAQVFKAAMISLECLWTGF